MKRYSCLILLVLSFCLLMSSTALREVYGGHSREVRGRVLDENGDPLQNATVAFWQVEEVRIPPPYWVQELWKPSLYVKGFLETTVTTDANGFFNAILSGTLSWSYGYRLYVYTVDFRYMPLVRYYGDLSGVPEDLSFQLTPAASFILDSDVLIINSTLPWESLYPLIFYVNPVSAGSIYTYCDPTDSYFGEAHSYFLGLEPRQVIVPANTSVEIRVAGVMSYHQEEIYHGVFSTIYRLVPISISFNIDRLPILEQGQIFHIYIREYSLQYNLLVVQNLLQEVETLLDQAERKGFYASAERRDLTKSRNLLISAESKRVIGLYADSYADVLEAYQIGSRLSQRINGMYLDATFSAIFFPLFFAFTAVAVVSLLFESEKLKALIASVVYAFLLISFYHLYPGSRVADILLLIESSIGFISAVLIFSLVLPRLVKETTVKGCIAFRSAIVALFSLAKRNMKRRRLRSILTLAVVTVSIAAFVALTSFSVEYGLIVRKSSRSPSAEGLLVREAHILPSAYRETFPFAPMSESDIAWLATRDRVVSVAPRSENPRKRVIQYFDEFGMKEYYDPLGNLALSQNEKMFFSVIGIVPSAEASATHLDSIIKTSRYLNDNETNVILLSEKAANELGAQVGDELLWLDPTAPPGISVKSVLSVKLVGIFEDSSLDNFRDLDGQRFSPQKILEKRVKVQDTIQVFKSLTDCSPDEVIITTYQSAYNFSDSVYLSRVDVLVDNPETILPFARELVFMRNFRVWASIGESLYLYELGSYAEIGGSGIIIALIIVMLTIGTTMSASVYERRHEMNVLSAVGLNPSHITMLFVDQVIIIGLIGGAVGYLLGTALYQVFVLFPTDIVVRQKLSLGWSLVALTIGIVATTLGAAIPAIKASVLVTPSLLRRWKIEKKPSSAEEPYTFEMPVKVQREDINDFVNYLIRRLLDYKEGEPFNIKRIRKTYEKTQERFITHIKFTYFLPLQIFGFLATNDIAIILEKNENVGTVQLASRGSGSDEEKHIRNIASLIRNFIFEWSSEKTSRRKVKQRTV